MLSAMFCSRATSDWWPRALPQLKVTGPVESAERLTRAFEGEKGPVRDYLLANSATAIWTTGRLSIRDGMEMAASAIDSGAATRLLERCASLRLLLPRQSVRTCTY